MKRFVATVFLLTSSTLANADIRDSQPDGFRLKMESYSSLPDQDVFKKIGNLPDWWSGSHTYSGSAENLSLTDMAPGGSWRETWPDGQVEHARVIATQTSEQSSMIRFDAPLGPLQEMGVRAILTITVSPDTGQTPGQRSKIAFDYIVTGASFQKLDQFAPIVDQVLTEQLNRLAED